MTDKILTCRVGDYDGKSSQEQYLVDAVADIAIDWRTDWVKAFWSKDVSRLIL